MKPDDFEQQLQRQPLQAPPAAWREELLKVAHANIRTGAATQESELRTGWRALMARISPAWGAVAAVWLIIIGVNSLMSGPAITVTASAPASVAREPMTVWNLQRAEFGSLATHPTDALNLGPAPRRPAVPAPPRSDRRREDGLGEIQPDLQCSTFA